MVGPHRGRRMTGSAFKRWTLCTGPEAYTEGGGSGGGGGLGMTGSAFKRWTLYGGSGGVIKREEVWGRGGSGSRQVSRLADFFSRSFSLYFSDQISTSF